jgi:hypothetical protein
MNPDVTRSDGGCTCRHVRYRLTSEPLYVHCCQVAVWSNYAGAGATIRFVRVGTLDAPDRWPPDIHIYTSSKQPWVVLPPGTPAVPEYYRASEYWPQASLERRAATRARPAAG